MPPRRPRWLNRRLLTRWAWPAAAVFAVLARALFWGHGPQLLAQVFIVIAIALGLVGAWLRWRSIMRSRK